MKVRAILLALPLLAACESEPFTAPETAPALHAAAAAHGAPVASEGYLDGAGGVRLFYRVVGTGPDTAVVLSGGPGLTFRYLSADLEPLARGRTVIFYDPRGAGRSTLTLDVGMPRHAEDLEAVRRHFGLGKMSLVGHSWGAMLAVVYAADHPQNVDRLLLLNPGPVAAVPFAGEFTQNRVSRTDSTALERQGELAGLLLTGQAPDPVAACEEFFTSLFSVYFADTTNARFSGRWCGETPEAAAMALPSLFAGQGSLGAWDFRTDVLPAVQAPTLVIHGAADVIPLASSRAYADFIPGARFRVIEDAGHFMWLERPAEFFAAANTFLRRENL